MSDNETLDTALADVARWMRGPKYRHPSDDELEAYEAGELAAEDQKRVENHLVGCTECATLVLELSRLEPKELGEEDPVSEHEIEQCLRRLRSRIPPAPPLPGEKALLVAAGGPSPRELVPGGAPTHGGDGGYQEVSHCRMPTWHKAVAASLMVAVVGLAAWVVNLRSQPGGLEVNSYFANLSDSARRGTAADAELVEVPAGSNSVTLVLFASKLSEGKTAYDSFRIEIAGAGRTWSRDGVIVVGFDSFTVALPKKEFPAGVYTLRILGSRGGKEELVAEYAVRLRYS